jgi:hypothetical protein
LLFRRRRWPGSPPPSGSRARSRLPGSPWRRAAPPGSAARYQRWRFQQAFVSHPVCTSRGFVWAGWAV